MYKTYDWPSVSLSNATGQSGLVMGAVFTSISRRSPGPRTYPRYFVDWDSKVFSESRPHELLGCLVSVDVEPPRAFQRRPDGLAERMTPSPGCTIIATSWEQQMPDTVSYMELVISLPRFLILEMPAATMI